MIDVLRAAAIVRRGDAVLLRRRMRAPNAGFFELPEVEVATGASTTKPPKHAFDAAGLSRLRRLLAAHLRAIHGLSVRLGVALPLARHTITRHRIATVPLLGRLQGGRVRQPLSWVVLSPESPVTTSSRRILAAASAATPHPREHFRET